MSSSREVQGRRRLTSLDGVRAFAVIAVSLYHLFQAYRPSWNPLRPSGGYLGVDVFFVLSGFLITSLLQSERERRGNVNLRSFYARRALRLFPALAVLLVVIALVSSLGPTEQWSHPTLQAMPWVILYVSNWNGALYGGASLGALGHTWSLGVEEQFYLLWPVILLVVCRLVRGTQRRAVVVLVAAIADMGYRFVDLRWRGANLNRVFYGTDLNCDCLLLGCALALYLAGRKGHPFSPRISRVIDVGAVAGVIGLAILVCRSSFYVTTWGLWCSIPLTGLFTTAVLLNLLTRPLPPLEAVLAWRPLAWIGERSYGLYLWMTALIFLVSPLGHRGLGTYTYGGLLLVAAVAIAALSYRVVEIPFLRKKANLSNRTRDTRASPHDLLTP